MKKFNHSWYFFINYEVATILNEILAQLNDIQNFNFEKVVDAFLF